MSAIKACMVGFGLFVLSSCAQAQSSCGGGTCQAGSPYFSAHEIPGTIEAEHFDRGGEGVGYSDSTHGNSGIRKIQGGRDLEDWGMRMDEDVDITEKTLFKRDYVVGWTSAGEFLRYTVRLTKEVRGFETTFAISSASGGAKLRIVAGGTGCDDYTSDLTGLVHVWNTGGYDKYMTMRANTRVGLPQGTTYIWLCVESGGFNIDNFHMGEDYAWLMMHD